VGLPIRALLSSFPEVILIMYIQFFKSVQMETMEV